MKQDREGEEKGESSHELVCAFSNNQGPINKRLNNLPPRKVLTLNLRWTHL